MEEGSENPSNELLKHKYSLHNSPETISSAQKTERLTGEKVPQDPSARIQNYLDRIHNLIEPAALEGHSGFDRRERNLATLKRLLYDRYVVKPEQIPDSFWENQRRIIRERGQGADLEHVDFEELKRQNTEALIADQRSSLDTWIDYFASPDSAWAPDALKYWAFRSVLGMSEYDKEKMAYPQRSKGTTKPFPDLNREALAYVLDAVNKQYTRTPEEKKVLEQELKEGKVPTDFEKLLQSENFAKLYAYAIEKITPASAERLAVNQGKWVKYDQGSKHMPLVESLQGHGTGWCTAGESTARIQLQGGDFYVFYSNDQDGNPTIPRVAIRMEGQNIAEVRGIAKDQNLDEGVTMVVDEKLKEFPDGELYKKKVNDMQRLTAIDHAFSRGQELSSDDLRFLYEIDGKIQGFGYNRDPRIDALIKDRNIKEDLSSAWGCRADQISVTRQEALREDILFHYGNLDLSSLTTADGLKLPESIGGDLYLSSLTTADGLKLPESIGGNLYLSSLTTADGLKLPESIGGNLYLSSLTTADGLKLPESIGGNLYLNRLTTADGLKLPESIGGNLDLYGLTTADGLKLPESIGGNLDLDGLTTADGLKLPESIGGNLYLNRLTTADGLKLPESIGGNLYLNRLTTAEKARLKNDHPEFRIY